MLNTVSAFPPPHELGASVVAFDDIIKPQHSRTAGDKFTHVE